MIRSMTGFASATGSSPPHSWSWEVRSVNGKGLDVRVRAPDWIEGLEAGLRKRISAAAARGNITCNLRLTREESGAAMAVNAGQLQSVLDAISQIEAEAMNAGVSLAPSKASDIVALRGVLEQSVTQDDGAALCKTLLTDFDAVLNDFNAMRTGEGAALTEVLASQLTEVENLTAQAATLAAARKDEMAATLRANIARVLENADGVDESRLAQELALLAVKADVTEEIDRLGAHVAAARDLMAQGGPIGRKFDFLMQEFNREANTLCSKAQNSALTAVGLALKAVIDQMREQVQNVE
ncbi:YicC/YloC family endoribonuclease [Sulfitobacter sp. JB4-11]|uniref:YicC/YloC family endoribonuclease n=1 Tax=Sulfitobacter rhodophyticola TaxID=3238304 RepID=UPI003512FCB3